MGQYEDYQIAARSAIKELKIPYAEREDAMQEAGVAFFGGESVIKHLRKWRAAEVREGNKVMAFGNARAKARTVAERSEITKVQAEYY